jgi:hypothetical protein
MTTRLKYTGSTPGADTNTYTLFSSVTAFPGASFFAMHKLSRLIVSIKYSHAGTLKGYRSEDRGVTWTQVFPDTAVAAPAAGATNVYDLLVEEYADFKLDWTNGNTAQNPWMIDMVLSGGHAPATP